MSKGSPDFPHKFKLLFQQFSLSAYDNNNNNFSNDGNNLYKG